MGRSEKASKKSTGSESERERLSEDALERYDWSTAKRGRYAGKLKMGSALRRLDDDLVEAFPNSKAVNDALRAVLALGNVLPALARRAGKRSAA